MRLGRQRKEKRKIKINSSRDKADKRKECQRGSRSESEQESDDMVILHANHDSELVGNLTAQKMDFCKMDLRISSVIFTKSAVCCGFGHIY